jgi:hypothetical protein
MTFVQKLILISGAAAVIAAVVLRRGPVSAHRSRSTSAFGDLALSLAAVTGSLLVVGVVSDTFLRHVVQIAPLVVALGLVLGRSESGVSAAAPLFAFWFLVMGAIWLFLLGLARIFTGRFTPVEVALTIVIGAASLLGLFAALKRGSTAGPVARLATIGVFALLQCAAMWLSTQPFITQR